MKLNLGCGDKKIEGFFNIDNDPSVSPDIVLDLNKDDLPFETSTVDTVVAFHVLEHIGDGFMDLIKEIYRVCKPNAIVEIVVPHYNHWSYYSDPTHVRSIDVNTFSLFSKTECEYFKKNGGSNSQYAYSLDVDFEYVMHSHRPEKEYEGMNLEQLNAMAMKYNNVVIETYIQLKVLKNG